MAKTVKFERVGFNPEVVTSMTEAEFVKANRGLFFKTRKPADRDEMLKRVYALCKKEIKGATS